MAPSDDIKISLELCLPLSCPYNSVSCDPVALKPWKMVTIELKTALKTLKLYEKIARHPAYRCQVLIKLLYGRVKQ